MASSSSAAAGYDYDDAVCGSGFTGSSSGGGGDLSYDPNFVPDAVKTFVVHLYRHIRERNVYEIHQMYEGSFHRISDRMFSKNPWPSVDAIAPYVDNDHVFCLLYQEMWYRHCYARLQPTAIQRVGAWDNYCSLFSVVLEGVVNIQLPNQWLWDMVEEFVYQFQSFCQWRAKLKSRTEEDLKVLKDYPQAWNPVGVLNFLQALVEKSSIREILEREKEGLEQFTVNDGYDYKGKGNNVLKVLGYYSMVGLLQVHCLLGDYYTAVKRLAPIDISQAGVYTVVIGCHISVIYHYGFASLMMRRYVDAIREFNKMLVYNLKYKQYHQKSPQYDQILKKNEQMYALLAICLSLCPQTRLIDENVHTQLKEKYGDKMAKMHCFEDEAFSLYDELFSYACPKFITPATPKLKVPLTNYNQDAYRLQLKMFLLEVKQQQPLAALCSILRLYSTLSIEKLATLLEVDEDVARAILLTYKNKMYSVDSDGKITSNADILFFVDKDIIHIADSKPSNSYGDYYLRQAVKFEESISELEISISELHS